MYLLRTYVYLQSTPLVSVPVDAPARGTIWGTEEAVRRAAGTTNNYAAWRQEDGIVRIWSDRSGRPGQPEVVQTLFVVCRISTSNKLTKSALVGYCSSFTQLPALGPPTREPPNLLTPSPPLLFQDNRVWAQDVYKRLPLYSTHGGRPYRMPDSSTQHCLSRANTLFIACGSIVSTVFKLYRRVFTRRARILLAQTGGR